MSDLTTEMHRSLRDAQSRMSAIDHKVSRILGALAPPMRDTSVDNFVRGLVVVLCAQIYQKRGQFPPRLEFARSLYGEHLAAPLVRAIEDPASAFIARAAHPPALTTQTGWAADLGLPAVFAGPLASLAPTSVYAQLAGRGGPRAIIDGAISMKFPGRAPSPSMAGGWYVEGVPIRVVEAAFLPAVTLAPNKLAVISTFTNELAKRSVPDIEAVLRQAMSEDTSLLVDSALLDTTAAGSGRPAGLLNGITPITATAITGGAAAALAGDMGALAQAITRPSDLVYLMPPAERVRALSLSPGLQAVTIIEAPGLPAKQIAAIDAADLCTIEGDAPQIELSESAVLHMDDAPAPISATGTPNVVAAPTRSMWQTDCTSIRMLQVLSWAVRRTGRIATVANVTW